MQGSSAVTFQCDLTSRQETDNSAHLEEQNKQHHASSNLRFDLHSQNHFSVVFKSKTTTCFGCITLVHGQLTSLSRMACLYMGIDRFNSSLSQRVARG